MPNEQFLQQRREVMKLLAAAGLCLGGMVPESTPAAEPKHAAPPVNPLVGIQIAAHSFYDEGIDHCLDLLQETAGVNAPMVSPYAYYGAMGRPLAMMADHGVPKKDNSRRKLPALYVQHHEKYFTGTSIRHARPAPDAEYAGRDILADLAGPIEKRGMKLYVRIYEPGDARTPGLLPNWAKGAERDAAGKPLVRPCFNNPEYRAWMVATVRDLFENHPIAGLQFGAERMGPLGSMLHSNGPSYCFCEHCMKRARENGIDGERARLGMIEIRQFVQSLRDGAPLPGDGALMAFLRILFAHPDVLAWEREWHRANSDVHKLIFDAVKAIRPMADVGRHVSHIEGSFDPFYRAAAPYGEMAGSVDFVKTILYHEIFGPRLIGYLENTRKALLRDFPLELCYRVFCAYAGHDPDQHPPVDRLPREGFGPEYVYRESKRATDGLAGTARFYGGIGTDIPRGAGWGGEPWPSDPDRLYQVVRRCFDAGATGIVISREYEENRVESLRVVGRAVKDAAAG